MHANVHDGKIVITPGLTTKEIAFTLEKEGIIDSAYLFLGYIAYEKYSPSHSSIISFKTGEYTIQAGNFSSLVSQLNKNGVSLQPSTKVTFPEGIDLPQMGLILEKNKIISASEFLEAARDKTIYLQLRTKFPWLPPENEEKKFFLEGYLVSDTYFFDENKSSLQVMTRLLEPMDAWYAVYQTLEQSQPLLFTFDEMIILASIVERESKHAVDRPKVAQVFYNRLHLSMKLQSDATVNYVLPEHKTILSQQDISVVSPYNTYLNKGLPVGAISEPSRSSFDAVLYPEGDSFTALYFYARPSGETIYASTYENHEQNRIKYEPEWKNIK